MILSLYLPERRANRQPRTIVGLLVVLSLLLPLSAIAGEIVLSTAVSGQWQISARGLTGVHALDLDLRYDEQRLSALIVSVGEGLTGMMTAINDRTPGIIRLGVASIKPLPTDAILLKLQTSVPGAEMLVRHFSIKTVDETGKVVPTIVRNELSLPNADPLVPTNDLAGSTATTALTSSTSSITPIAPAALTQEATTLTRLLISTAEMDPDDETQEQTSDEWLTPAIPQDDTLTPTTSLELELSAPAEPDKLFHRQEEVISAIELLPQPWTIAAIKNTVLKPASPDQIRQEPPMVIADGKSKIMLYLPKSFSKTTPSIGVQGV